MALTDQQITELEEQGYREGDIVPGKGRLTPEGTFVQDAPLETTPEVTGDKSVIGSPGVEPDYLDPIKEDVSLKGGQIALMKPFFLFFVIFPFLAINERSYGHIFHSIVLEVDDLDDCHFVLRNNRLFNFVIGNFDGAVVLEIRHDFLPRR